MQKLKLISAAILMASVCEAQTTTTFPRLMTMQTENNPYADANYQQTVAKFNLAILGFYNGWTATATDGSTVGISDVLTGIKTLNPNIMLGQFTILDEAYNDPTNNSDADIKAVLDNNNWWLLNAAGEKVQWTSAYGTWDINITKWSTPLAASDSIGAKGDRYPQWLAKRDYKLFFQPNPKFDIWFFNNAWDNPDEPVLPSTVHANWKNTKGKNLGNQLNTDPVVAAAFRSGEAAEWATAKKLAPNLIQMGNVDPRNNLSKPEYKGKLGAAHLYNLMGYDWSMEKTKGWVPMMQHYYSVFNNLAKPKIVGFEAAGTSTDYQSFRFAYASCLLNNGYFSYVDSTLLTNPKPSSPLIFDEYNINLGAAIDPPPAITNLAVVRRHFKNGLVLVNPGKTTAKVKVAGGYYYIKGTQDPSTNTGAAVNGTVTLPARSGIVLINYKPS